MTQTPRPPDAERVCDNCGYFLRGLGDATRCPECGVTIDRTGDRRLSCRRVLLRWLSMPKYIVVLFITWGVFGANSLMDYLIVVPAILSVIMFAALYVIAEMLMGKRVGAHVWIGVMSSMSIVSLGLRGPLVLRNIGDANAAITNCVLFGPLGFAFCGALSRILQWTAEFQVDSRRFRHLAWLFPVVMIFVALFAPAPFAPVDPHKSGASEFFLGVVSYALFLSFVGRLFFALNRIRAKLRDSVSDDPELSRPL
jgi:hypothetical protein